MPAYGFYSSHTRSLSRKKGGRAGWWPDSGRSWCMVKLIISDIELYQRANSDTLEMNTAFSFPQKSQIVVR